jgi:hypothetical protein
MTTIRYKRHFQILILAAVTLLLSSRSSILDYVPAGNARFVYLFALIGALHATSLVVSLRHGIVAPQIAFVVLAAVWSVVTIILASLVVTPVLDIIPWDSLRFFSLLLLASALGASGYWLLVRWFWLKSLQFSDFVVTVALCMAATLLGWGAMMLTSLLPWGQRMPTTMAKDIEGLIPTVAWWAAFSGSLYWSELRGHVRGNSF